MSYLTEKEHERRRLKAAKAMGEDLRSYRLKQGRSQEQVALEAGIAVHTYSSLERGESASGDCANPRLDTLLRVLRLFGHSVGVRLVR